MRQGLANRSLLAAATAAEAAAGAAMAEAVGTAVSAGVAKTRLTFFKSARSSERFFFVYGDWQTHLSCAPPAI